MYVMLNKHTSIILLIDYVLVNELGELISNL